MSRPFDTGLYHGRNPFSIAAFTGAFYSCARMAQRIFVDLALGFLPEEERKEAVVKSCKRCFQALRIDVNSEFEVLYSFLEKLPGVMAPGGRAAILTFHSGEDRLVKHYFKEGKKAGLYQEISGEVIRPSAEECQRNPRARSTKMRWAIRAQE